MQKEKETLADLLSLYAQKRFLFVKPGGNHGDMLIYIGLKSLAKYLDLRYKEISFNELRKEKLDNYDVVYIHGSGGFVPWWSGTPYKALKIASQHKKTVIIGPSTFHLDEKYIYELFKEALQNNICENIYIYCRERSSYNFVEKVASGFGEVYIDHDTAFHATYSDILQNAGILKYPKKRFEEIYALRTDNEIEKYNYPRLNKFAVDPIQYNYSFKEWVTFHIIANSLITNRLHSAIMGALMDVDTTILPNSYHKNRSVWEYSLKNKGVKWEYDISNLSKSPISIAIQKWLRKNPAWQRRIGRIYYGSLSCTD
ncbi:MAG: polysaccharide pyruvyl transferase family protein [Nanobdellota archaeon]